MLFPTAISLLFFSSTAAAAALEERSRNPFGLPILFVRQVNDPCLQQGQKTCGINCIDLTASCCPGGAGGCPASAYCALGTNGQYGCCPNGQICTGAASSVIITTPTRNIPDPTGLGCPAGNKICGFGCIENSNTCCDGQGGCPRGQSCTLGDNSLYGCCSIGSTCTGDGGFFLTSSEDIVLPTATRPPITASGTGELEDTTAAVTGEGGFASAPTSGSTLAPVPKKKSSSNIGAIVGGIVGGIAVLVIIALIVFFFVIKPRRKDKAGTNNVAHPAPAPAPAAMGSYEPKLDNTALAGAAAYNQQQQHYQQQQQQPNRYSNATELASPVSPQPYQNAQWGNQAGGQYAQGTQGGYPPQGAYAPKGGAYAYSQSPPPGGFVPQPGAFQQQPQQQQQQQQQQNYYQGAGYPTGSPANPLNAELPAQHQAPQPPPAGPGYQAAGGYPQQGAQNPPTTYAELPGSQR